MKTFTNLHTADWHLYESNIEQTKPAIEFLTNEVHDKKPDSVTIAGDLGVKRGIITATESTIIRSNVLAMAEICKVYLCTGNHDQPNHYNKVDTVRGILSWDKDGEILSHPNVYVGYKYHHIDEIINGIPVRIYFLPHPSKYVYLTNKRDIAPTKINSEMSKAMETLLLGVEQDRISYGGQSMLIGHGTIKGGIADSEIVMTTEHDLAIDKNWLPNCGAIQYGHLHKKQIVGRGVYSGAIAPLVHTKIPMEPSYCWWEIPEIGEGTFENIPIPVAHQLITVDINNDVFTDETPPTAIIKQILNQNTLKGANIRCRVTIDENIRALIDQAEIRRYMDKLGAHDHKLMIESEGSIKIRATNIDSNMAIDDLITTWTALDPDRKDYLKDMIRVHSEVMHKIPADKLAELDNIDYEIISIKGRNYKPLKDIELIFDVLGSLVCITGENHIGKSQLAEIERFVFWKILRRGTFLSDVVRIGESDADVSITFRAKGQIYNVMRMVSLNKHGNATGTLNFTKDMGNGEWKPVNEGSSGETQLAIEKVVGTYSMYRTTRFGSQSDIDLLCRMRPSEIKDAIQEAMSYVAFGVYQETGELMLSELEKKFESSFERINELKESLKNEPDTLTTLDKIENELKIIEGQIGDLNDRSKLLNKDIDKHKADVELSEKLNRDIKELAENRESCENNIINEQIHLNKKPAAIEKLDLINKWEKGIVVLNDEKNGLVQLTANIDKQENELQSQVNNIQSAINNGKKEIEEINTVITTAKNRWDNKLSDIKQDIERYNEAGNLVKDVPCAGLDIQSNCKLLANARSSNNMADEKQKELSAHLKTSKYDPDYDKDLINAESGLTQDKLKKEELDKKLTELSNERTKLLEGKKSISEIAGEITIINDKISDEKLNSWTSIKERAIVAENNIINNKSEIEKIETKLDSKHSELSDLPLGLDKITRLKKDLQSTDDDIKIITREKDSKTEMLGTTKRRIEEFKEKRITLSDLEKINKNGVRQIRTLKLYRQAMSRNGIPYLLLEKALPQFEKYSNEFLCADEGFPNSLRVQVKATKETQAGIAKDEVVISFIDDRGTHPLGEASGFQKVAIGYALRASMAKLQAQATGAVIHHCIFDEGWGAFDQPNQLLGKRIIQKLGEEFEKFFFITHVPALQEVADTRINVFAADGGADIEII